MLKQQAIWDHHYSSRLFGMDKNNVDLTLHHMVPGNEKKYSGSAYISDSDNVT